MQDLVARQRRYFDTNATKPVAFRLQQLRKLAAVLTAREHELDEAVAADVGKSRFENLLTELYLVHDEIRTAVDNLEGWATPRVVPPAPLSPAARGTIVPEPLGVSLVIGPWNYPFQLTLAPLVAAIAAGCTVVVKPSELMPHCSAALARILGEAFDPQYLAVVEGGIPETTALLEQRFDKIFFTGSVPVGKIVYQAAAKHLTPVTLELGGKSPVIVMPDSDLTLTARRLVWGKLLNAGQTCIAPDYVYVHESVERALLDRIVAEIREHQYARENGNFVQIVNERNLSRLIALIDPTKVVEGGRYDLAQRTLEPTVLRAVTWDDRVMQEEIFGPILPVLTFTDLDAVITRIKAGPRPLALYLFTRDEATQAKVLAEVPFGGGCVNDTILHIANGHLPFGGVGDSGIGSYHGKEGFDSFSHFKSVLAQTFDDAPDPRYSPYGREQLAMMEALVASVRVQ